MVSFVQIRPMTPEDVPDAERLSANAMHDAQVAATPRGEPEPPRRSAARSAAFISRTLGFLETDPGGCWVAVDDSGLLGFAASVVRERLWVLVTFAVRNGLQGRGIGRQILEQAEASGAGCDRGMLAASDDPRALRRYHAAGFELHPQMVLHGRVDRSAIPAVDGLRDGDPSDLEWMNDLDRDLRGAPHGPDHAILAGLGRLVVTVDRAGYAYSSATGPEVIAARDIPAATRLLWEFLASAPGDAEVSHVTSANIWAADVALRAGLRLGVSGYLGVRSMPPPSPYIHSGPLL
jgi:GNAT superfamily N-acetyltransferase